MPIAGTVALDDRSFARFLVDAARTLQAEHDPERILEIAAERIGQMMALTGSRSSRRTGSDTASGRACSPVRAPRGSSRWRCR